MSDPTQRIDTPPSTTLSTPSPTELQDTDPLSREMPPSHTQRIAKHIYLVVATTPVTTPTGPRLGIGLNGQLPWPMIKADMAYFRKVTTNGYDNSSTSSSPRSTTQSPSPATNAVIMGRKTYESIPPKFRPLSSRHNYVVTRSNLNETAERYKQELIEQSNKAQQQSQLSEAEFTLVTNTSSDIVRITSSNDAIKSLTVTSDINNAVEDSSRASDGALFCIGGAEIYKLLLQSQELRPRLRILQTEMQKLKAGEEYECDTFWPEDLDGERSGWREVSGKEALVWTGVDLPQGDETWSINERVGVRLRVRGWEVKE